MLSTALFHTVETGTVDVEAEEESLECQDRLFYYLTTL